MIQIARRRRPQAPPPWVLWEALVERGEGWLVLRHGEIRPEILESRRPEWVVWSSLDPSRPGDRVEFAIEPDHSGCRVELRLMAPDDDVPEDAVARELVTGSAS